MARRDAAGNREKNGGSNKHSRWRRPAEPADLVPEISGQKICFSDWETVSRPVGGFGEVGYPPVQIHQGRPAAGLARPRPSAAGIREGIQDGFAAQELRPRPQVACVQAAAEAQVSSAY